MPQIMRSAAYDDGGLIAITFDQAPQSGPDADSSSCCNQPETDPNLAPVAGAAHATPTETPTESPTDTPTPTPSPAAADTAPAPPVKTPSATPTPAPTATPPAGPLGGGKVGLLLISPLVQPNSTYDLGSCLQRQARLRSQG